MKNLNTLRLLIFMGITIFTFNTNAQNVITYPANKSAPEFYDDNEEIKNSVTKITELIDKGVTVNRLRVEPTESYHTWGSEKTYKYWRTGLNSQKMMRKQVSLSKSFLPL